MLNLFSSSKPSFLNPTFTVFIDKDKDWRWHIKGRNGEIVAASPEGFLSKKACLANLKLLGDKILLFHSSEKIEE